MLVTGALHLGLCTWIPHFISGLAIHEDIQLNGWLVKLLFASPSTLLEASSKVYLSINTRSWSILKVQLLYQHSLKYLQRSAVFWLNQEWSTYGLPPSTLLLEATSKVNMSQFGVVSVGSFSVGMISLIISLTPLLQLNLESMNKRIEPGSEHKWLSCSWTTSLFGLVMPFSHGCTLLHYTSCGQMHHLWCNGWCVKGF